MTCPPWLPPTTVKDSSQHSPFGPSHVCTRSGSRQETGISDMCVALAGQDAESNGEGEADDKLLTWGA